MWPSAFWERVYEPLIRRAGGLGRAAHADDPDAYEQAFGFCDILIVGSGPSGLAAGLAAARSGARVTICEQDFRFGGRLLAERCTVDGMPSHMWLEQALAELRSLPDVTLMPRTTVFGVFDSETYGAVERVSDHLAVPAPHQPRQRLWRIVARRTIVAAGAVERPIAFDGNDRPGIMLASAIRTYVNRFATTPGRAIAIFTNNNDGWCSAADLMAAGVRVEAVIDSRPDVPRLLTDRLRDVRLITAGEVRGTSGRKSLRSIVVRHGGRTEALSVDALGVSGGWNPNIQLTCQHGAKPRWKEDLAAFVPGSVPRNMMAIGAANGTMTLGKCLSEGASVGRGAAASLGFAASPSESPRADDEDYTIVPFWHVAGSGKDAFVDFQNDVTLADLALAAREGFRSVEHLKRYTTLGMGTDQGKTANVNAIALMAELTGRSVEATGTTRFRPPDNPVAIGAFAGHHRGKTFRPVRYTPSHGWAQEQGALFVETGEWLRAKYFPQPGEREWLQTVSREVRTVRSAVGVCDVSTLGKIDLQGSDAAEFLDRLYINVLSTLPVGRVRYGVMLRDDGFVFDDGTTTRLADDHFLMTTTTANAGRVFQHMQFCHQILWPALDVQFVSVTDQWAQFSVAGPRARDVLAAIVDAPFDLSNAAFPHMAASPLTVCGGVQARLFRLSFSGELAYEIAVPARYGDALARLLMDIGRPLGLSPYGTEALGVMRIEKGHIAGNEIDGRTTAGDLGLGRLLSTKKDFIGRVMAGRRALTDPTRSVLVGLKPVDPSHRLRAGAHIIPRGSMMNAAADQGVITSVAYSPERKHWIGLGLVVRGSERVGERMEAADPVRSAHTEVELCRPCFLDPKGERLHA
jgi:sarcosine oxidase subunit alpha